MLRAKLSPRRCLLLLLLSLSLFLLLLQLELLLLELLPALLLLLLLILLSLSLPLLLLLPLVLFKREEQAFCGPRGGLRGVSGGVELQAVDPIADLLVAVPVLCVAFHS